MKPPTAVHHLHSGTKHLLLKQGQVQVLKQVREAQYVSHNQGPAVQVQIAIALLPGHKAEAIHHLLAQVTAEVILHLAEAVHLHQGAIPHLRVLRAAIPARHAAQADHLVVVAAEAEAQAVVEAVEAEGKSSLNQGKQ